MKEYLWVPDEYAQESDCPFKAGRCTASNCLAWMLSEKSDDVGRCILLPAIDKQN